ncbi:MAG TPA: DUF1398 family protein [Flavisolibacter sp.]|nr:DUF1398 family protein [Flavisolibacter sp.]
MFTVDQIQEKLSQVRTGADFPLLAMNLKNMGVTYYETSTEDGRSIWHGEGGYELRSGPAYERLTVADTVNSEQLKEDIKIHQQGGSDYFGISRQCADNGIGKWAVCLITMTCTYLDKEGRKVWVENIPDGSRQKPSFTLAQIKSAHSKVASGADFPAYIQAIKGLGVAYYETFVKDGRTDYYGTGNDKVPSGARYDALNIAATSDKARFKADLKAHQEGKSDYPTFCRAAAQCGVEKWAVSTEKMTCTYYDRSGKEILVEEIPG